MGDYGQWTYHTRATTNFKGGMITFSVIGERGVECRLYSTQ